MTSLIEYVLAKRYTSREAERMYLDLPIVEKFRYVKKFVEAYISYTKGYMPPEVAANVKEIENSLADCKVKAFTAFQIAVLQDAASKWGVLDFVRAAAARPTGLKFLHAVMRMPREAFFILAAVNLVSSYDLHNLEKAALKVIIEGDADVFERARKGVTEREPDAVYATALGAAVAKAGLEIETLSRLYCAYNSFLASLSLRPIEVTVARHAAEKMRLDPLRLKIDVAHYVLRRAERTADALNLYVFLHDY